MKANAARTHFANRARFFSDRAKLGRFVRVSRSWLHGIPAYPAVILVLHAEALRVCG